MILHVLLVEVAHPFSLPVQTPSGALGEREGLFQHVVAELGPHPASGWVALWVVRKQWLHFLLGVDLEVHNSPENRSARVGAHSEVTGVAHTDVYQHTSCTSGCTYVCEGIGVAVLSQY